MKSTSRPAEGLVPAGQSVPSFLPSQFRILVSAGKAAAFAAEEFFFGRIRNEHTRAAYLIAVKRFLRWAEACGLELRRVTPANIGAYYDGLRNERTSVATRKQHLAALRHFFDALAIRHAVLFNPALSVRGERYQVVEGKTPEITVEGARRLLASIDREAVAGKRDIAIVATLIYTACRAGAVAGLRHESLYRTGDHWMLHFEEKGGKSREIPVRSDLAVMLLEYIEAAGLRNADKGAPLFQSLYRRTGALTGHRMTITDIGRMMKRRLKSAGLPGHLSPHSCRVTTLTDLFEHGAADRDVQHLAGHADPRTTKLYDRRQRRITRNIVERISI
jgi:site-specific recombinase XerD